MMASLHEEIVNESVKELEIQFSKLLCDKNTITVSSADPPKKKLTSYPVHRLVFAKAFGVKLTATERISLVPNPIYHIRRAFKKSRF